MGFLISLLQAKPQAWAHHLREQCAPALSSVSSFSAMAQLYADPFRHQTAEAMLSNLHQGQRPMEGYVSSFQLRSAYTKWNTSALHFQFILV